MAFNVPADAYGRFMGRYSEPLSDEFFRFSGVAPGQRVLDVGCGPGALTARLVDVVGASGVSAVDPSEPFVAAASARLPGVDVRRAVAEDLPFPAGEYDAALAQLVVHFMSDPVAGLAEMARVTRPGGLVAACVWDFAGQGGPLGTFWQAARSLDPAVPGESALAGVREGHLAELFGLAGMANLESGTLTVRVRWESFEQWWEPFTFGVGPAGDYVKTLSEPRLAEFRAACAALLPEPPFEIEADAWAVRATITPS